MIPPITFHKLNEKYVWVSDQYPVTAKIRVIRVSDGYFYNKTTKTFTLAALTPVDYEYSLTLVVNTLNVYKVVFDNLPKTSMDLLFEIDVLGTKT